MATANDTKTYANISKVGISGISIVAGSNDGKIAKRGRVLFIPWKIMAGKTLPVLLYSHVKTTAITVALKMYKRKEELA
jgi:hypothetical protein